MNRIVIFIGLFLMGSLSAPVLAQQKSEKIRVSGECGMCKKKIETSAKSAGATYALWDQKTKQLAVKYNSKSTSTAKIEQAVAKAGYDTQNYEGDNDAYKELDECCKYERKHAQGSKASQDSTHHSKH